MTGVIDNLHATAVVGDRQRRRQLQLFFGAQCAVVQRGAVGRRDAAAETQLTEAVQVLNRRRHPVVAASHVVQRQVGAYRHAALVGALAGDRPHVAGLAAVIARGIRVLVVGTDRAVLCGRVVDRLERASLQVLRQARIGRYLCLRDQAGFVLAEGTLDNAIFIGWVIESRLAVDRSSQRLVGSDRSLRYPVIVGKVANRRVRDVVAGAAEIDASVVLRLHELMARLGVVVGTQLVAAAPHRTHAGAIVALHRISTVISDEWFVHDADVLGIVRVRKLVAVVALDSVAVACCEARAVGRRRASGEPAAGAMTAYAQIARAIEILFGDSERCPKNRVATGLRHHTAAPVVRRFDGRVVAAVAVVALVGRLEVADLLRLRSGLLDIGRYRFSGNRDG